MLTVQVWAPAGLPWWVLWVFEAARAASNHGVAFGRVRVKQDDGNPHKRNDHGRFSHVLLCTTAHTSGVATLQQQSRFKVFPLRQQQTVLPHACVCVCAIGPTRACDRMLGTRDTHISRTVVVQLQLCMFICFALLSADTSHRPPSYLLCSSHSTTAAAPQGLPLVTATDGACLCMYMCMCANVCHPRELPLSL